MRPIMLTTTTKTEKAQAAPTVLRGAPQLPPLTREHLWGKGRAPRFGIDAEYFFLQNGQVVPADNYLPPQFDAKIVSRGLWGVEDGDPPTAVYYDGIQGEFSVAPSTCRAYVLDEIQRAFRTLYFLSQDNGLTLHTDATVNITAEVLENARDKRMAGFGCAPSNSRRAGGRPQRIQLDGDTHLQRYAGMHIHLGNLPAELDSAEGKLELVRWLDLFVGLFGVFYENDLDRERRKVYGKAGEYREKSYGLEYRTPSPRLFRHPALVNQALALARTAVVVAASPSLRPHFNLPEEAVISAIDNVDLPLARTLYQVIRGNLERLGSQFEGDIRTGSLKLVDFLLEIGPDNFFTGNLHDSWNLHKDNPDHGNLTPTFSEVEARVGLRHPVRGVNATVASEYIKFRNAA